MIAFIVSLSFFMEALDSTIINTAIPAMSRSLSVEPIDLKLALISYLLSLAIFIPISGWLADKFGAKKIFLSALAIFTLSSLWCGFADSLLQLVIARFIQGLGGALGLPVGRLIIIRTFGREKLISKMNYVVTIGAMGIMLGPVVGGFITHYFSWHWIFWINIPAGLVAIILAYYYLPKSTPNKTYPLDKIGFILFGMSLAGFTFGLSAFSETSIKTSAASTILLVSILLMIAYMLHSHRQLQPIVKTDLLRLRTFRVSLIGNLIARLGFGGVPFLVPLLLQISLGYSPEASGMLLAPTAIGILLGKPIALPLLRLFGYKRLLIINTFLAGVSIWIFAIVNSTTSIYVISLLTFMNGFMLSLQYSCMNSLGYADVAPEDLSAATSMMSTLQQLSQSFGVAVSALFIRLFSSTSKDLVLTSPIFHYTFFAMGFFTILSSVIFIQLQKEDGRQMIV
jgi:EmrB/QacA subfamily drug resistance transporter